MVIAYMIEDAIEAFKKGEPVLIYDSDCRERETDLAYPAASVKPKDVLRMRKDAGGLICVAIHPMAAKKLSLPFMEEILNEAGKKMELLRRIILKPKYDRTTSFSLWVNHKDTFTGITDVDRALTIRKISEAVEKSLNGGKFNFFEEFVSPGHVALLRAADNLIYDRAGHTELSIALAEIAGIVPAVAICEMLDEETGRALTKQKAMMYAKENEIPFVEGNKIIEVYKSAKFTRS